MSLFIPDVTTRQFEQYLEERVEAGGTHSDGEHLEQDIRQAGFEDIEIKKVFIDIGDWRDGKAFFLFLSEDSPSAENVEGRRAAERVQGGAYESVANSMTEKYPDDAERSKFANRVRAELIDYHFYFDSYAE